jgi:hypothetical protein
VTQKAKVSPIPSPRATKSSVTNSTVRVTSSARPANAADTAAAPVIEKYTGVLAAADVFTASTTFWVMESIRLDLGYASQVHP